MRQDVGYEVLDALHDIWAHGICDLVAARLKSGVRLRMHCLLGACTNVSHQSQDSRVAMCHCCRLPVPQCGFRTFTSCRFRYLPTLSAASYSLQRLTSYKVATPLLTCAAPAQEMSPTLSYEHGQQKRSSAQEISTRCAASPPVCTVAEPHASCAPPSSGAAGSGGPRHAHAGAQYAAGARQ